MRPPATVRCELPSPIGTCQRRRGPAAGQLRSRFTSGETPSRWGPRNCGQSPEATVAASRQASIARARAAPAAAPDRAGRRRFHRVQLVDLVILVILVMGTRASFAATFT